MYDPYYLVIGHIEAMLRDLILHLESDNVTDKRLGNLIKADEELKKAMMKDSCFRR